MKKLHLRLFSRPELVIPPFGPVSVRFQIPPRYDGYVVQRAKVHLFAEHDCPSDLSIYLEAPSHRRVELFYRDDQPDWSIALVRDCTDALRHLPVSGTWFIIFDDLVPIDGGIIREVGLYILATKPSLFNSTRFFDHYISDPADLFLTRPKHHTKTFQPFNP